MRDPSASPGIPCAALPPSLHRIHVSSCKMPFAARAVAHPWPKRVYKTAMFLEMVDLVVQAVKGTRVGGYASAIRTYTGVQLIQLLDRVEEAIEELGRPRTLGGESGGGVCLAERVSGREGPFQLRIRAGDSACVLTRCIGAFEVWLCSTTHHEPCEPI